MSYPDLECTCKDCVAEFNEEHMDRYGFYVEYNFFSDSDYVDFHTVGFEENYGHPEFQIVLPVSVDFADFVFHCIANRVIEHQEANDFDFDKPMNKGTLFNLDLMDDDNIYDVRIFDNVSIDLVESYCQFNGEWFVRLIFPNTQDKYTRWLTDSEMIKKAEKFNNIYKGQYHV